MRSRQQTDPTTCEEIIARHLREAREDLADAGDRARELSLADVGRKTIEDAADALVAIRPPPKLDPHEWAEANLTLPKGTTPEEGRWRSRPFQADLLREVGNPKNTDGVLSVAASQVFLDSSAPSRCCM